MGELLLKAHFNVELATDILKKHDVHQEGDQIFQFFSSSYFGPKKKFFHHKYAKKDFYNKFALQGSYGAILLIMKLGVFAKWTFKWP